MLNNCELIKMTDLEQAIAAITKATPKKSPWSVADFADDPDNAPEIDAHIATILNAVATGQLVPAQVVTDDMVERATMTILGHVQNGAPDVDWSCNRQWRVSDVRKRMRLALEQILPPPPAEGV